MSEMRSSMWNLMMTFIRLGAATKRSDDWGFGSKHDLDLYVTLKARQIYKLRKDTEHAIADWHNSITLPEDMCNMWGFSTTTVSTTTTNACVEVYIDEYAEDYYGEAAELATLEFGLHHQHGQQDQIQGIFVPTCSGQSQGAFSYDSS